MYAVAFILTLVIEAPVYVTALTVARLARWPQAVAAAAVVNLTTHPFLYWLLTVHVALFGAAEVAAWLVEAALLYFWLRRDLALLTLTALVANLASVLAGLALLR